MMRNDRRKPGVVVTKGTRINYKELETLAKCMTPQGKILPRRRLGVDAKTQHALKVAIHRARFLGLLPYGA
ncbi:MAG: 30S ribosomal protein S18 [Planctomycetota bacterium]